MVWAHDELLNDLADSRVNPRTMVWRDMQLGPSGSRRPDVFTLQKSYTRPSPTAYEIKVSRSDFRSDVTSGKYMEYLRFAECVVFAVPDGLVKKTEVPEGCGLIVRKESVWRYAVKPTRKDVTQPRSFWMKLVIDGIGWSPPPQSRRAAAYRRELEERKKLGDAVAAAVIDLDYAQSRVRWAENELVQLQDAKKKALADCQEIERAAKERGEAKAQKSIEAADAYMRKCAHAIGLPEDQARHEFLSPYYRSRAQEITESAEVRRLTEQLDIIKRAIEKFESGAVQRLAAEAA